MRTTEIRLPSIRDQLPPVSVLGMGCSAVLGRTGRRESLAALGAAYDAGITFYDTARSYGYGSCEGLLGEFFSGRKRDSIVLCTKFGIVATKPAGWKQHAKPLARVVVQLIPKLRGVARSVAADQFIRGQFSVELLNSSVETSLRELKTDYVDMLLLHAAPISVLERNDLMEALERLVQAGKVRLAGISGDEKVISAVFASRPPVLESAQFAVNMFNLTLTLQTERAAQFMFLVANNPFGGPEGVKRCRDQIAKMRRSVQLPESLREKLDLADDLLLPEIVLNCILSGTGISAVLPAMMHLAHLKGNIKAIEHCRFSPGEIALIRAALQAERLNEVTASPGATSLKCLR